MQIDFVITDYQKQVIDYVAQKQYTFSSRFLLTFPHVLPENQTHNILLYGAPLVIYWYRIPIYVVS